jgi:hypothetical protein
MAARLSAARALRELAVAGEPVIERRIGGGGRFVAFRL